MRDNRAETVLLVGVGDLTTRLTHLLALLRPDVSVVLASRSTERAERYANLVRYCAHSAGRNVSVEPMTIDLREIAQTAEKIAAVSPSTIFMGASMQAARAIMNLPQELFVAFDAAQLGPWLPMHLAPNLDLMQAVKQAGSDAVVVNGAYPDAVGPALRTIGLQPSVGIGNVGNIVPAIEISAASSLGVETSELSISLIAHHYFSHHVHRFGEAAGIPYDLRASIGGHSAELDHERIFESLSKQFRRQGGRDGQELTARSAYAVVNACLSDEPARLHVPAPGGLPGGYPTLVSRSCIAIDLAQGVAVDEASEVNRRCQVLDGIESISPDGVITNARPQLSVLERLIGFGEETYHVSEARMVAEDLHRRYQSFLKVNGLEHLNGER